MKTLTSKEISKIVRIGKPLKNVVVTQEFGPSKYSNLQKWYTSFGWKGHNGIDFRAPQGQKCYAVFPGTVVYAAYQAGGGNILGYDSDWFSVEGVKFKLRFYYLHLYSRDPFKVKVGERVDIGQFICRTGNTGKYTTGPHLHFHITPIYKIGSFERKDYGNKYDGAVDPEPLFADAGWQKIPVDKYYDKKRNWVLEFTFRFANNPVGSKLTTFLKERIKAAQYVHRVLKIRGRTRPILTARELNAIIYGSWDLNTVLDPAMFPIWGWYTKAEYEYMKNTGDKVTSPLKKG